MTIDFILNGEDVVIQTQADIRLLDILRDTFGLGETRIGCLTGCCGACTVFFNGNIAQSCLIPAFRVRSSEIVTIEAFSQTDEYQDILEGFSRTGHKTCGFCTTGKILALEALLERKPRPGREDILPAFNGIKCRCTDPDSLIEAVLAVSEIRRRRIYGRST
jgi:carbon-monoxide dehydrogenase small subunit